MEATGVRNHTSGANIPGLEMCPTWAGGNGRPVDSSVGLDRGWTLLNFTLDSSGTGIEVEIASLMSCFHCHVHISIPRDLV